MPPDDDDEYDHAERMPIRLSAREFAALGDVDFRPKLRMNPARVVTYLQESERKKEPSRKETGVEGLETKQMNRLPLLELATREAPSLEPRNLNEASRVESLARMAESQVYLHDKRQQLNVAPNSQAVGRESHVENSWRPGLDGSTLCLLPSAPRRLLLYFWL